MSILLLQADARQIPLADKSIQCVVTSPPYYGLRDYGVDDQLGLEPTLDEYIENTLLWTREVWRVLRDDGTFWLNIGDSYAGSGGPGSFVDNKQTDKFKDKFEKYINPNRNQAGFKPKDLMGVPWRVALALQADGWYLRSDIIWHKPNPMPESVRDRPTKSHEYIFLLTKSPKYFYDADAIKEKSITNENRPAGIVRDRVYEYDSKQAVLRSQRDSFKRSNNKNPHGDNPQKRENRKEDNWNTDYRNKRTVWTITTKPYSGSHFATFPPELPETCIKAGTKPGDTILDPFGGSGTTAMVAQALGRNAVHLDISAEYLELARERTNMKALDEWQNGIQVEAANLDGLPMFS